MGTIRTTGKALKEVEYDKVKITMSFNTRDRRSKDAIRKVIEECELFLCELKKIGVDTSSIRGGRNNVSRNNSSYNSDKGTDAVRTISWESDYDLKLIDAVMKLSEKGSYDIDISIDPRYSKKSDLCKELMKEAVIDARAVADSLAGALGAKVKCPAKINASGDYDYISDEEYMDDARSGVVNGIELLNYGDGYGGFYSELKKPTTIHTESITIEWELED